MWRTISLALLLVAIPAMAQDGDAAIASDPAATTAPEAPPVMAPRYATTDVQLDTSLGVITLRIEDERAPLTAANFLRYVDAKRLDGIEFFRAVTFPDRDDIGLVQAGQHQAAKLYPPIAHEPTSKTGLVHDDGAISMARGKPGTAQADFFIIVGGLTGLDAEPGAPGDNAGYAVFGHVTEGMDVVRRILLGAVDADKGEGVMKGQMLAQPVLIRSARRLPPER